MEDKLIKTVENSLADTAEDAILGMFGDKDTEKMLSKMHDMIDFADKLHVKDITIKISLRKAKKEFETVEEAEDVEVD
jgi:folylpolyglutamate synthase/dihydropteroate synthase